MKATLATLPPVPNTEAPAGYIDNAVLYATGLMTAEELAAAHHVDASTALAWLADPETAADVDERTVIHRQSGKFARAQAAALLTDTMSALRSLVAGGELSASTLVRIADVAARVSGILAPDKAALADKPAFSIQINLTEPPDKNPRLPVIDVTPAPHSLWRGTDR